MKMKRHGLSFWLATVLVAVGASLLGAVLSSKYVVRLLANLVRSFGPICVCSM